MKQRFKQEHKININKTYCPNCEKVAATVVVELTSRLVYSKTNALRRELQTASFDSATCSEYSAQYKGTYYPWIGPAI